MMARDYKRRTFGRYKHRNINSGIFSCFPSNSSTLGRQYNLLLTNLEFACRHHDGVRQKRNQNMKHCMGPATYWINNEEPPTQHKDAQELDKIAVKSSS